jgi:hydroxymethylbilane synthase
MDRVPLRLGTRGSTLALVQARWVEAALLAAGVPVEVVLITTAGDVRAPDTAWGEGAFVTAIEAALLDGRIDAAVHSAKDVPTVEDHRLAIAAYTVREDARDALVCRVRGTTVATLPEGARVGTDSPRRNAFLRAVRPDLAVHPLSGNVDTRLRKLDAGESDALVLAVAGLTRLGHADRIDEVLPLEVAVPAPGQGALAIQVRVDDERARDALATLDDPATRAAVEAERRFLHATGGGCRSPIGCFGAVEGDEIVLRAAARRGPDGAAGRPDVVRMSSRGPLAERLAQAEALAERIVRARRPRVLVTRPADGAGSLATALRERGMEPVAVPAIAIREVVPGGPLDERVAALATYDWAVVTSASGAGALGDALARSGTDPSTARWAAVGEATAAALEARGIAPSFSPSRPTGAAIAAELPLEPGARVLLARGDLADPALADGLVARGAAVDDVVAYETVEGPDGSAALLAAVLEEGPLDAIVFGSGSAVRGLLAIAEAGLRDELRATVAVCIGPSTGGVARAQGFGRVVEAPTPRPDALADTVAAALGPPDGATTAAATVQAPATQSNTNETSTDPAVERTAHAAATTKGTR